MGNADGAISDERFVIQGRIGAGGMGVVYRAWDRERDQLVALKTLKSLEPETLYRFKREFRILADLRHANLVTLHELASLGDRWFFTMELVNGVDFLRHVRGTAAAPADDEVVVATRGGEETTALPSPAVADARSTAPLDAATIARLRAALAQLVAGLGALHAAGHLHRDLKPGNVMVTHEGRVVVLDFGVASETRPHGATATGELVGTPAYIAPEAGMGEGVREASDWYSVGVMIYEALVGRRPFVGDLHRVMTAKRMLEPTPPSALVDGVPADLEDMCLRLLQREPSRRPSGAELARWLGAAGTADTRAVALVGRDRPLAELGLALASARGDGPRLALVHGSSGMGKSALVAAFLAEQRRRGAVTLAGRCYLHESVPYKGLDHLMDELAHHLLALDKAELAAVAPPSLPALAQLFPVLRRLEEALDLPWLALVRPDPHELRRQAVDALRMLLARMAARAPLVLHIDDAQWGDAESAQVLTDVLRAPGAPPLLLIVSVRSEDEQAPMLRGLQGESVRRIAIARLPLGAACELAAAWLDGAFDADAAERIARESGGVPFWIEQMARHVRAQGDAAAALGDVVAAQLEALDPEARGLLSIIALAGRPLSRRVALDAAGLGAAGRGALDRLIAARLARGRGLDAASLLECSHDRIREAAAPPPDRQGAAHLALARALIADDSDDAEAIAFHLDRGGDRARAGHYHVAAGDHAAGLLAFAAAVAHYQRALAAAPVAAPDVLVKLADALCGAGLGADAVAVYRQAAEVAEPGLALRCRERAAEELLRSGHIDEGLDALRTFLPSVGLHLPRRPLLALLTARARLAAGGLGFRERPDRPLQVEERARLETCFAATSHLGMTCFELGAVFQSWYALAALRSGEVDHAGRALGLEAVFRAIRGRPGGRAAVERLRQRAAALASRSSSPLDMAYAEVVGAMIPAICYFDGRRARDLALEVLPRLREHGLWWYVALMEWVVLIWSYYLGDLRGLCERADQWTRSAERRGDRFALATVAIGTPSLAYLVRGDLAGAQEAAAETERAWRSEHYFAQHYWALISAVNNHLYAGDGAAALARCEREQPRMRRASLHHIHHIRIEAIFLRGRAAIGAATASANADAQQLLAGADREGARLARGSSTFEQALGALQRACVAGARGDRDTAVDRLRAAIAAAERAELINHAQVARARLGGVLGGDEGAALVRDADAWLAAQGVVDRDRWLAVHVPGF